MRYDGDWREPDVLLHSGAVVLLASFDVFVGLQRRGYRLSVDGGDLIVEPADRLAGEHPDFQYLVESLSADLIEIATDAARRTIH